MNNLANAPLNELCCIKELCCGSLNGKLCAMGVYPNAEIKILKRNRGSIKIACGSTRLALSMDLASKISLI